MYYISDMSKKNISKIIFGLKPLTTDHADRFPSGWGWFRSFQPPLGAYTQRNNENLYINFRLLSLRRPYFHGYLFGVCHEKAKLVLDVDGKPADRKWSGLIKGQMKNPPVLFCFQPIYLCMSRSCQRISDTKEPFGGFLLIIIRTSSHSLRLPSLTHRGHSQ